MGGEDRVQEIQGQNGGPLRLLGYLKDNKRMAYVLAIMVMLHLSNQYDRQEYSLRRRKCKDRIIATKSLCEKIVRCLLLKNVSGELVNRGKRRLLSSAKGLAL